MDEETGQAIKTLAEQFINLTAELTKLRSYITVLLVAQAQQLEPGQPLVALKFLQDQAKAFLNVDPLEQDRRKFSEAIDALNQWKKAGGHQA
jgi:hypothetical protein